MSRSIFTRASSALSRASSICSGVTGRSPAPLSCPRSLARTQLLRLAFGMPSTWAVTCACAPDPAAQRAYAECAKECGFKIDPCQLHNLHKKGVESGVKSR